MCAFCSTPLLSIVSSSTIAAAVRSATALLRNANVPEPAASAEHLAVATFTGICSRNRARLSNQSAPNFELNRFSRLIHERATRRTPVQYLVGDWDFHNVTLQVRPPVLIPRPETEELVEHVLADKQLPDNAQLLDIGCGSGAIVLAMLAARAQWTGIGVDISEIALALSRENAMLLGLNERVKFIGESAEHLTLSNLGSLSKFDVIVSNPPYIPKNDMVSLVPEVKLHEDSRALCGGHDGLDVIRQILFVSRSLLKSGRHLWLEVDESHPALLSTSSYPGLCFVSSFKDMYGRMRFCQFVKE